MEYRVLICKNENKPHKAGFEKTEDYELIGGEVVYYWKCEKCGHKQFR